MTAEQLARDYVRSFCAGDLPALEALLAEDFHIEGPLYTFNDRDSFLARLRALNAPVAEYQISHCVADGNNASVFFLYRLGKLSLLMAMHLGIRDNCISHALLVFDTARLPARRS